MKSITNIISIALIGGGAAGFAIVSKPLVASKEADVPLNVLGINRSPYGEVFAMAMQGPIGTYFHAAEGGGAHKCDGSEPCQHEQLAESQGPANDGYTGMNDRVKYYIEGMASGLTERTNPRAASAAHKFYLRRGIEDKLRFAYNLDPGHYGNYNAYHFFLTEPQLGTRPELTPMAAKLADETIAYCLSRSDDPRLALTAAAASANVIELMFNDRHVHPDNPRFSVGDMRKMLNVTDKAIGSFSAICENWTEQGLWENLSELRLMEIEERMRFVMKVRESQGQAIAILSMTPFDYGIYNPANKWRSTDKQKLDPFGYGTTPSVDGPNRDNGKGKRSPDELSGTGTSSNSIASHNQ
jgi:hypothetical protein